MSPFELPAPRKTPHHTEHEVAQPERARNLLAALPEQPEVLEALHGRHVISMRHFSRELMIELFRFAAAYETGQVRPSPEFRGRILISAFLDQPNNRTRLSFESAALRLGVRVMSINETLRGQADLDATYPDLVEIFNSYGDMVVLRTREQDSFARMLEDLRIPTISVGDGVNENPTQALVDLYTLFKWRPDLLKEDPPREKRIQIGIFGEPWRTRTIRSLLLALKQFPNAIERVLIFGRSAQLFVEGQREELEGAGLKIQCTSELYPDLTVMDCLKQELPKQHVIYSHMVNPPEVSRMDRLEALSLLRPNAMVLHPRVRIREMNLDLDNSPFNGYFTQARSAVYVRMAVMHCILGDPVQEATAE